MSDTTDNKEAAPVTTEKAQNNTKQSNENKKEATPWHKKYLAGC